MDQIMNYVKPELIVVAIVLYFIGIWLKKAAFMKDKYIPLVLGIVGIFVCGIWVMATAWAGYRTCGIYSDCTGYFGGRIKYLCESNF